MPSEPNGVPASVLFSEEAIGAAQRMRLVGSQAGCFGVRRDTSEES